MKPAVLSASPIRQSHSIIANLDEALCLAQAEYPPIEKKHPARVTKNNVFLYSFKYADLADVMNAIRPVLAKHGLNVKHLPLLRERSLFVICRLSHKSGEWIEVEYPAYNIGDGINHQTMGGALTFAKRQTYAAVTGVAAEEDDKGADADDGDGRDTDFEPEPERKPAAPPRRSPPRREAPAGEVHPLITEMLAVTTPEALAKWHSTNTNRIVSESKQWQDDVFYPRYDDHLAALKTTGG